MLSDDSSSDSETGRFKGQAKTEENKGSNRKEDTFRSSGRNRPSDSDRFRRDVDRRRNDRDSFKYSRDKQRYSRQSPVSRRRNSRNRSPRRSHDRNRRRNSRERSKTRDRRRSISKDRRNRSRSKSHKDRDVRSRSHKSAERSKPPRTSDNKRDLKDEIRRTIEPKNPETKYDRGSRETKYDRGSREKTSSSPELGKKQSEVHKPPPSKRRAESPKRAETPIAVEHDSDHAAEVQPGSYYSMIPAIVKDNSEESSEIDSSDDERLRAKLLNLEKELQKTKKKKHKKKHKYKSSKTRKEKDDANTSVEVTSTTDIQDVVDVSENQADAVPEVTSTQKGPKESSEEGEISSDDNNQEIDYDLSDLRHKLRSRTKTATKADVCGPALPPHLENQFRRSSSVEIEGPMLPPHLQPTKHIGPSIPNEMRKVLAEKDCEIIEEESSDEDAGIGPLPVGAEDKWSDAHQQLEERALDIKIKKLDGRSLDSQKIKSREQWMLELPEGKAKIMGLEARSFRAKEGPDMSDRSSWTDTPEEKAKKAAGIVKEEDADEVMRREARAKQIANRDEEQESAVKKHKKKHKREESLLEIHQKKLKKKKKKEEKDDGKQERRPFSRDVDLQVNRFDEAQKKSIIKKAQGLNSRFSKGEAKYL